MEYCVLYLERIVSILSTKYLEKWSRNDFTDVNILAEPALEFYHLFFASSLELVVFWLVFVPTGAYLSKIEPRTESYC